MNIKRGEEEGKLPKLEETLKQQSNGGQRLTSKTKKVSWSDWGAIDGIQDSSLRGTRRRQDEKNSKGEREGERGRRTIS